MFTYHVYGPNYVFLCEYVIGTSQSNIVWQRIKALYPNAAYAVQQ